LRKIKRLLNGVKQVLHRRARRVGKAARWNGFAPHRAVDAYNVSGFQSEGIARRVHDVDKRIGRLGRPEQFSGIHARCGRHRYGRAP